MVAAESDLTQASVQLTLSPVVYAIALHPEDPSQLRAAVILACACWGGIRFPWLSIAADGSVSADARDLCDVLDVTGIIDLTRSDPREPAAAGIQALGLPVVGLADDYRGLQAMPIRGVVEPTEGPNHWIAGNITDTDIDPASLLSLGMVDETELEEWQHWGQRVAVPPEHIGIMPQLDGRTAIGVTAMWIDSFISTEGSFLNSAALVWLLPDKFTLPDVAKDLVMFWNYRALRPKHRDTVTVLARLESLKSENIQRVLVDAISRTASTTPMCVLNGFAVGEDALREVAETLGFRVMESPRELREGHHQRHEPVELTATTNFSLGSFWLKERYTGTSRDTLTIARRPRWQARFESPLQWRYPEASGGLVSARLASQVITGPRTDAVAGLYVKDSRWRSGGVRFMTWAMRIYHFDIGMPSPSDILASALGGGLRFTPSDKGREIDGILAAPGDPALFRTPAFHAITAALTPDPSPRIDRRLKEFAKRLAKDPEMADASEELREITARARGKPLTMNELVGHPAVQERGLGRGDVSTTLTEMVARGLVRWGFERRCSLCNLTELVPLTRAEAVPKCSGCGRDAAYAISRGEPELHYALSSLLERVSRNAGLTPLAAAVALRQAGYYVVPGAEIPQDGRTSETDLLGWKDYRLLSGEAKAAASLFRLEDIARDIEQAASIGATTQLLACPEQLPLPLIEQAVRAAEEQGVELLQLTGPDLTSGRPPTHAALQIAAANATARQNAARQPTS